MNLVHTKRVMQEGSETMELKRSKTKWVLGIIGAMLVIGGLLRWGVFQPYLIPSPSM